MTPWLSVIMPVHGGEAYFAATLASVAAALPPAEADGVELLVYNSLADGGATRRAAEAYAGRLNLVWQDRPDLDNWIKKINVGAVEARARHIATLHQDDLWLPGHPAAVRAAIAAAPTVAMSIAPSRFVGPEGQHIGDWRLPFAPGLHAGKEVARTLLVQNSIAICAPVIARDAWAASGGVDPALWYTSDWDIYLKLARAGDVWVRRETTTAFRIHRGSLTMTGSRDAAVFRAQHDAVVARHVPALEPLPAGLAARIETGVAINCALAQAANGHPAALGGAAWRLALLGPRGLLRFLRESRLIDRLRPRLTLALRRAW